MKVFLINFSSPMHWDIAKNLNASGVEILYWIVKKADQENFAEVKKQYPSTIFHDSLDALNGIWPEGVNTSLFEPVEKNMIERLFPLESQAILMMERVEYQPTTIASKKHCYYEQLRYWSNLLKFMKPDAIVFPDVPHTVFNFILCEVARDMGIKTVMFRRTKGTVGHLHFFTEYSDYKKLREAYAISLKEGATIESLSKNLRDYYEHQRDPQFDSTPFYRQGKFKVDKSKSANILPSSETIKKNILRMTIFKNVFWYVWSLFHTRRVETMGQQYYSGLKLRLIHREWVKKGQLLEKKYRNFQRLPDYNEKFVYVPLHFQPECATNPLGGVFDDQILMIDTLANALPNGWWLYVKENNIQWRWPQAHAGRFPNYYEVILKNKNVRLVPADTSTFELMNHSQAVAGVTGTALWEAVLRSKSVLMFGSEWFMDCEGVMKVASVTDCREVFSKIQNGYKVDQNKVIAFLAALEKVSLSGYPSLHFKGPAMVSEKENVNNITTGILRELTS